MTKPFPEPANVITVPDGLLFQDLMGQINGSPGPRVVPGRTIPVPTSVSAELQTAIAMPYRNSEWLLNPPDAQGWKDAVTGLARHSAPAIEEAIEKLGVHVESTTLGGVPVFIVTRRRSRRATPTV